MLYGVLFVFIVILVETEQIPLEGAIGLYVGVVALQFFLAPLILDWWLTRWGSLEWVGLSQIPTHSQQLIMAVCKRHNLPLPRIGIIDDLAPQAFTYGNIPSNARLVFSRGMVELLEPEELDAVLGHELGHIQHRDFIFMTIAHPSLALDKKNAVPLQMVVAPIQSWLLTLLVRGIVAVGRHP